MISVINDKILVDYKVYQRWCLRGEVRHHDSIIIDHPIIIKILEYYYYKYSRRFILSRLKLYYMQRFSNFEEFQFFLENVNLSELEILFNQKY